MTDQFDGLDPLDYLCGVRDGNIVPTIENLRAALHEVPTGQPAMTDNDDWHAGYREGLRDGRNISTELAPSQEAPAQPQCAREAIIDAAREVNRAVEQTHDHTQWFPALAKLRAALSGNQPQCAREAIARKLAAWIGYSWDGLPDHSVVERGFREWQQSRYGAYQGGKPDLLRLANALMAHTHPEPQCAQVPEKTLADFLCDALERAGPGCDELAIAQALLATYSVTRPESETP